MNKNNKPKYDNSKMLTMNMFVLVEGSEEELNTTHEVVNWLSANLRVINDAGVKVLIEIVTDRDRKTTSIVQKLNTSYGIKGFPSLYIPAHSGSNRPETYSGWENSKKALMPVLLAGKKIAKQQISQVAAPDNDFDTLLKNNISFEAKKFDTEENEINKGLSPMDIQKEISRFNANKPGFSGTDTNNSAVEDQVYGQKNDNIAPSSGKGQRSPANTRPPMSPVNNRGDVTDDELMDNFFGNRIGNIDI
jgi:hypothetical protein